MKKEVIAKLKDIAIAIFDDRSLYEGENTRHSFTLIIHTKDKTLITAYAAVIQTCVGPFCFEYDYFYCRDTKDIAGFIIVFTDGVYKQ